MKESGRNDAIEARLDALEAVVGRLNLQIELSSDPSGILGFPEPIATPLAKESGAGNSHEKFFSLLDGGEACIQYTGSLVISLMAVGGHPIDTANLFRQPVSLGNWAKLIRESLQSEGFPDNTIGRAVKSSFQRTNGKHTPAGRYLLDEFINLRNAERGHGSSLSGEAYEQLHLRHTTELHDALGSCTHLQYRLARVESVDVSADPFSYDIKLISGPIGMTSTERIESSSRVATGALCVWDGEESLLDLGNSIVYRNCEVCNVEHTFFLERESETQRRYHSYFGNHRIQEQVIVGGR